MFYGKKLDLFYNFSFSNDFIDRLSLPFMLREPVDLPPIVSVELIQISDKTNIPYAPKARKIIEETKKRGEELYPNKLHHQQRQKRNQIEYLFQMRKKKRKKL